MFCQHVPHQLLQILIMRDAPINLCGKVGVQSLEEHLADCTSLYQVLVRDNVEKDCPCAEDVGLFVV